MANLSNIKIKLLNKDIASIIINEPKTYNALSLKNLGDLIKAFKKLDEDKNIKVIIIEGSGKGFSAGHNLKEVSGLKKREKYHSIFSYTDNSLDGDGSLSVKFFPDNAPNRSAESNE